MPRCPYRLSPSADPTRPRCQLDVHGDDVEHVIDAGRKRGRPPTGTDSAPIPVRAPRADLDSYAALPDEAKGAVREATARAFAREVRRHAAAGKEP